MCRLVWDNDMKHLFIEDTNGERKRVDRLLNQMYHGFRRSERDYSEAVKEEVACILQSMEPNKR